MNFLCTAGLQSACCDLSEIQVVLGNGHYRPFQMRAWGCITSYPLRGLPYLAYGNVSPAMVNSMLRSSIYSHLKRSTREGQKFPATIFLLFTWVHLYKSGSIYIEYEPLSFMPCNMNSIARLVALQHYHKDNAF